MAAGAVTESAPVRKAEYAFVWAFLAGFALIFAMKLFAPGPPVVVGVATSMIAVAIMALYMVHQKRTRPENERPRLGDEVYYLGLLYTLTSLCAALMTLFLFDEGSRFLGGEGKLTLEQRTDELIGSFGIALLTTIAGIVMRMTLQGRASESLATVIRIPHTGERVEREGGTTRRVEIEGVTVDLERYAYELRRQLQNATNAFTSHTNQAILQTRTVHAHMDEMMRAFHDGLELKASSQLERMESIYTTIAGKAEEALKRTESQQARVQSVLETLEAQVRTMDERIERIRVGSGETAENLGAIGAQAKASMQAFAESGQVVTDGLSALAAATAAEQTHQQVRVQFAEELRELLGQQAEEWTGVRQRASEALTELEQTNQALAGLGHATRRTSEELTILPDGLHKASEALGQLAEIANATSEFADLRDQAKALTVELVGVAGAGKRQEEALDATVEKLRALAEAAGHDVDSRTRLRESVARIADVAATAGRYGESLKDTEREIQRVNMGLKGVGNAMADEGPKLAEVLKQAILAFEEAKGGNESTRSVLDRFLRR